MTQNTQYRSPCPLHTQAHTTIGNLGTFHWLEGTLPFGHNARLNTHGKWHLSRLAKPRISKGSFGNSKYICMGILSQLPTRCVNTSFLWPGEVWIKHRQCYSPGHVRVKQPTIQPYCIRVFANTRQFASCHPGTLFCANCRIRPSEFACQITLFCKSLYPITLSKLLHWIVALQIAMLDIFLRIFAPSHFFANCHRITISFMGPNWPSTYSDYQM